MEYCGILISLGVRKPRYSLNSDQLALQPGGIHIPFHRDLSFFVNYQDSSLKALKSTGYIFYPCIWQVIHIYWYHYDHEDLKMNFWFPVSSKISRHSVAWRKGVISTYEAEIGHQWPDLDGLACSLGSTISDLAHLFASLASASFLVKPVSWRQRLLSFQFPLNSTIF